MIPTRRTIRAALRPLALTVLVLAVAAVPGGAAAQEAAAVHVDEVRSVARSRTAPVLGSFVATQEGVVAAQVAAPVDAYLVAVGDRVQRGDTIVMLDDERLAAEVARSRAALNEAQAALKTAKAERDLARQKLDRQENLEGSSAYSKARVQDLRQELAIARAEVASAETAVASARAELRLARIDLERAEVQAPYSGVVTERQVEVGAYAERGAPLVSLVSDHSLEIEAAVPANRLGALEPGDAVTVKADGEVLGKARVRAVLPRENRMTRTRTVRFVPRFDARDRRLAAGASVTVMVPLSDGGKVLTVHKDAILRRGGQTTIYVYADGKARVQPVKLGDAVGHRFVVLDGAKAGDLAVVRGNERLRPGQPLTIEKRLGPSGAAKARDGGSSDSKGVRGAKGGEGA